MKAMPLFVRSTSKDLTQMTPENLVTAVSETLLSNQIINAGGGGLSKKKPMTSHQTNFKTTLEQGSDMLIKLCPQDIYLQ